MKLNFLEQEKATLMGHSICPGVQKGGTVNVDIQNNQTFEKDSFKF